MATIHETRCDLCWGDSRETPVLSITVNNSHGNGSASIGFKLNHRTEKAKTSGRLGTITNGPRITIDVCMRCLNDGAPLWRDFTYRPPTNDQISGPVFEQEP